MAAPARLVVMINLGVGPGVGLISSILWPQKGQNFASAGTSSLWQCGHFIVSSVFSKN